MEKYYLIKKSDVDAMKSTLPNSLESDCDAGRYAVLSMIGVELGKEIDLSDEAINEKANDYADKVDSAYTNDFYGYAAALKDLKQTINDNT